MPVRAFAAPGGHPAAGTSRTRPGHACARPGTHDQRLTAEYGCLGTYSGHTLRPAPDGLAAELVQNHRFAATERRWNRTIQPEGCSGLPVLKTGWATRPLPLHAKA